MLDEPNIASIVILAVVLLWILIALIFSTQEPNKNLKDRCIFCTMEYPRDKLHPVSRINKKVSGKVCENCLRGLTG